MNWTPRIEGTLTIHAPDSQFTAALGRRIENGLLTGQPLIPSEVAPSAVIHSVSPGTTLLFSRELAGVSDRITDPVRLIGLPGKCQAPQKYS